ncbi:hypothetical protein EJ05DRAFT_503636 [Pseudovirgaria hyperparasitica]|uniref:Uncharacterized protein n=1 Tax=Pseudovirgaria hyperparasitica TaxID=470096 RepID=A0A6A6VWY7_9PEZI|nr:uncharacterized protein EJ05DRAFT_503636 [Pseudovirgaria hyperparasitica]KAF2754685.1 hypothetical protein EJ05DRAFT_503636 [Pseudovirgaria hyperparasitica]
MGSRLIGPGIIEIRSLGYDIEALDIEHELTRRGVGMIISKLEIPPVYYGDETLWVDMPLSYRVLERCPDELIVQISTELWFVAYELYGDPHSLARRLIPFDEHAFKILLLYRCWDIIYDRTGYGRMHLDPRLGLFIDGIAAPIYFDYDELYDDYDFDDNDSNGIYSGPRPEGRRSCRRHEAQGHCHCGGNGPELLARQGPAPSATLALDNFPVVTPSDSQARAPLQFGGFSNANNPSIPMNEPPNPNSQGAIPLYNGSHAAMPNRGVVVNGRGGREDFNTGPGVNQPPVYDAHAGSAPAQGDSIAPVAPTFGGFSDSTYGNITQQPASSREDGCRRGSDVNSSAADPPVGQPPAYRRNATGEYPPEKRGWH